MATAHALFTQDTYPYHATVECRFDWSGAFLCDGWTAHVRIEKPLGTVIVEDYLTNSSQSSSNPWILQIIGAAEGTYYGCITVWDTANCNHVYSPACDSCIVEPYDTVHLTLDDGGNGVCGANPPGCKPCYPPCCDYVSGTWVTLTATPDSGYIFDYWSCYDPVQGYTYNYNQTWNKQMFYDSTIIGYFTPDTGGVELDTAKVVAETGWDAGCDPYTGTGCNCGDEPNTQKTVFLLGDSICGYFEVSGTDLYGVTLKQQWMFNGENVYEHTWTISKHYTSACYWRILDGFGISFGAGTGNIRLYANDVLLGSTVTFTVGQASIVVSPTNAQYFQDTLVGECSTPDEKTITVTSDGQENATTIISLVGTNANQFQCTNLTLPYTWTGAPGTSRTVTIKFCPTSAGDKSASLRFVCSPCNETYQVQLHGTGTTSPPPDPPCIGTSDPLEYSFIGTTPGTCSEPHTWQITNYGDSMAYLVVTWPGAPFEVSGEQGWWYQQGPLYWEIPAGQTKTAYVRFCPTTEGDFNQNIVIQCREDISQVACNLWEIPGMTCGSLLTLIVNGNITAGSTEFTACPTETNQSITAYFTWNNAIQPTMDDIAYMYIKRPDQTIAAYWVEDTYGSTTGTKELTATADQEGTWTAHIDIAYYHDNIMDWVSYEDICSIAAHTLSLLIEPEAAGQVTADPDWQTYPPGAQVELTAQSSLGYQFDYWTGDLTGQTNPVIITMNKDKTITAHFKNLAEVTCYGCTEYGEVKSQSYPLGTTCTETDTPGYPYTTYPDCSGTGITKYLLYIGAAVGAVGLVTYLVKRRSQTVFYSPPSTKKPTTTKKPKKKTKR